MINILRAEFSRLFREPFFYALAVLPLIPTIPFLFLRREFEYMQLIILYASLFTGAVPAILIPHLIGTEYSDGTVRNKLSTGHRRAGMFFVYFIVSIVPTLLIFTLCLGCIAVGSLSGGFKDSFEELTLFIVNDVCALCVISAMCAVISTSIHSKAAATAISLVLNFFIAFFSYTTQNYGTSGNEAQYIMFKVSGFLPWTQLMGTRPYNYSADKAYEWIINSPDFDPAALINRIMTEQIAADMIIVAVLFVTGLIIFAKRDVK